MPQLVFTILHQLSLEWKANNVLNRDVLHFERCSNSPGETKCQRLVEGSHNKTLRALNEVKEAGLELGRLASSQSGGFGTEIETFSSTYLAEDGIHMETGSIPFCWFTFSPSVTEQS